MAGKSIAVTLTAITGAYEAAMARAAATTKAFGSTVSGVSGQVGGMAQSTGMLNTKLIGAAGVGFALKSTADAAIQWESSFAGVRKTVDGTTAQLAALEEGLLDMSTEVPVAATELAKIAETAGQLGIETGNIEGFTEVMAQLSMTTNMGAEEAATSLARFANIAGTSQDDFGKLGSSIVFLGNNFATTEREIVDLGLRMAAAGRIAGLSEGDIFGYAAALSSVGVEAEAGGTALSKVFTSVNDAVLDGGEKLQVFAETAGMSADQFRRAFEDDAAATIAAFIGGLGEMSAAGESTTAVFETLELTDQRLMRALLSTAAAGDVLTEAIEGGNEAFEEGSAAHDEYLKRLGTTEARLQLATNQINRFKKEVGGPVAPASPGRFVDPRELLAVAA